MKPESRRTVIAGNWKMNEIEYPREYVVRNEHAGGREAVGFSVGYHEAVLHILVKLLSVFVREGLSEAFLEVLYRNAFLKPHPQHHVFVHAGGRVYPVSFNDYIDV